MKHLTLKHRIIMAFLLAGGGFLAWYFTRIEAYFKLFELSFAPVLDRVLFEVGAE